MDRQENSMPVGVMLALGLAGISLVEIYRRKIKPKTVPGMGVTTISFAESYKVNQAKARSGEPGAVKFMESANRRLREIHDSVVLNQSDSSQRFLLELSRYGITESDYLK
jgi:hypothetical protein